MKIYKQAVKRMRAQDLILLMERILPILSTYPDLNEKYHRQLQLLHAALVRLKASTSTPKYQRMSRRKRRVISPPNTELVSFIRIVGQYKEQSRGVKVLSAAQIECILQKYYGQGPGLNFELACLSVSMLDLLFTTNIPLRDALDDLELSSWWQDARRMQEALEHKFQNDYYVSKLAADEPNAAEDAAEVRSLLVNTFRLIESVYTANGKSDCLKLAGKLNPVLEEITEELLAQLSEVASVKGRL